MDLFLESESQYFYVFLNLFLKYRKFFGEEKDFQSFYFKISQIIDNTLN